MHLLFDAVNLRSPGGRHLLRELASAAARTRPADARLTVVKEAGEDIGGICPGARIIELPPLSGLISRYWWMQHGMADMLRRETYSALFELRGIYPASLLDLTGVVTTVNNMLPFSPEVLDAIRLSMKEKVRNFILKRRYIEAVRHADAVLLHSQHALDTLVRYAGDFSPRARVALTGVPRDFLDVRNEPFEHPYGGAPYFLYLSTMQPYKNHEVLVEGYRIAVARDPGLPDLLFIGIPGDVVYVRKIEAAIAAAGLGGRIKYLGAQPQASLPAWIGHAVVNFFPSKCETNSVVQSEILGMGAVMACSSIPPMSEVGGNAAELFDPYDPGAVAAVMLDLWRRPERREELKEFAKQRAAELSWDDCGRGIWELALLAAQAYQKRKGIR